MHRTIGYISKKLVAIRPGEGRKVLMTFLYFFLAITAYYVIKPVSRSLILDDLGHRMVPWVDLICAIVMGPIVGLFAKLVDRVSKPDLVTCSFWAVIVVTLFFWELLAWQQPWVAGAFYVWVSIFSVLVVTLFWLVANDLYRPRDAKRLFGFIGTGGILGGITGSSIAAVGAHWLGTRNLLLLCVGILVLCWLSVQRLWSMDTEPAQAPEPAVAPKRDAFLARPGGYFKLLMESRYLMLLVGVVGLSKVVSTLFTYQLNPFIEQMFTTADAKTMFNGIFFGVINASAFIVQFFLTSFVLRRWGLRSALVMLPFGAIFGAGAMLFIPLFWLAAGTELYDYAMNYSLFNTAKEMLYLPIDRSIRYKVKPFIDMVVFRFGKGLAAVIGILCVQQAQIPVRYLSLVTVPLLAFWIVISFQVAREYTTTIRTILQARAVARRRAAGQAAAVEPLPGVDVGDPFGTLTVGRAPRQKLSLFEALMADRMHMTHTRDLLAQLTRYEQALEGAAPFARAFEVNWLKQVIQDRDQEMPLRKQAIHHLARQEDQDTFDYLCGMLMVEEEAILRDEVSKALVRMHMRAKLLQVPIAQIRRQIGREVESHQRVSHILAFYEKQTIELKPQADPVLTLLQVLKEESVEQVFRLLMLLYRHDDIHLVYEQLRVPDIHVRADALELLDNLVDPPMRRVLLPLLDEDPPPEELESTYQVLQEAIWDHNCWLSVTTLCAVGRMRLNAMNTELERAARHTMPLVAAAAKVALSFVAEGP